MKLPWKLSLAVAATISVAAGLWWQSLASKAEPHLHYHAGFRIYIDDTLQDYSGYQYMNYTPCSEHDQKKSPEQEQLEKAHLHDGVGEVVHVHRPGAVWGDLLRNSKIELPDDKNLDGYIDGIKQENILSKPIEPYTTAVLLVGETNATRSAERVERSYIEAVEAKSELCGE